MKAAGEAVLNPLVSTYQVPGTEHQVKRHPVRSSELYRYRLVFVLRLPTVSTLVYRCSFFRQVKMNTAV